MRILPAVRLYDTPAGVRPQTKRPARQVIRKCFRLDVGQSRHSRLRVVAIGSARDVAQGRLRRSDEAVPQAPADPVEHLLHVWLVWKLASEWFDHAVRL